MQSPPQLPLDSDLFSCFDFVYEDFTTSTPQSTQRHVESVSTPIRQTVDVSQTIMERFRFVPHFYQVQAVETLLDKKDCILFAPTSAGKSLVSQCFPLFTSGWTLIIIPLIQLALEQQNKINAVPGLQAEFLYSENNTRDFRKGLVNQIIDNQLTHRKFTLSSSAVRYTRDR